MILSSRFRLIVSFLVDSENSVAQVFVWLVADLSLDAVGYVINEDDEEC
jgi:hypothetical protein